jgi:6-phosphofructokinase 1
LKIAVLTSGGVAPGMNAALRAAAQAAFSRGWEVLAVAEGYYGLLGGDIRPVDRAELWGYVQQGGTVLGTGLPSGLGHPAQLSRCQVHGGHYGG